MDANEKRERQHRYYIDSKRYLRKYNQERWKRICDARKKAMQEYYERNKALYAKEQAIIKEVRESKNWSMRTLGEQIGKSAASVCHYETGRVKAPWDDLIRVMPELKEARENA